MRFERKSVRHAAILLAACAATPALGQTAYFSLQGDFNTAAAQEDFYITTSSAITDSSVFKFQTYASSGGVNEAGDTVSSGGIDSVINLFNGVTSVGKNDDNIGLDSLLTWSPTTPTNSSSTPLTSPFAAGTYHLNLQEFNNDGTGHWAVDLVGPSSVMTFNGSVTTGDSVISSLKFLSDTGVAVFNHTGGSFSTTSEMHVGFVSSTPTVGHAALNLSGGTITNAGTTSVFIGSAINLSGTGILNVNDINISGGSFTRTGGTFTVASGKTLTASSDAQINVGSDYTINNGATFTINSGADLTATSWLDVGATTSGTLNVTGTGSTLTTNDASFWGWGGGTATVNISSGAVANLVGLHVAQGAVAGSTGTLTIESGATVNVNNPVSIAEGGPTGGAGTITVKDASSSLVQTAGFGFSIGHASAGTGTLNIQSGGTVTTSTGTSTVNPTGAINLSGGTFNVNGDIIFAGGDMTHSSGAVFNLAAGKNLTANASGTLVSFGSAYTIKNGSTFAFSNGADLSGSPYIEVGIVSAGTLTLTGAGTTLSMGPGTAFWGGSGGTATVTLSNDASATITGGLTIAGGPGAGTTGTVTVETGADMSIASSLQLATNGTTGTGTLTVKDTGSTVTMTGGSGFTVGHATNGTATVNVQSGAIFTTGTGTTTIAATGTINVGGTFNVNGDINLTGGDLIVTNSAFPAFDLAANKTLTANAGASLVSLNGFFLINEGQTFNFSNGADLTNTAMIDVGMISNGTLTLDGTGTTLTTGVGFISSWGGLGGTTTVTLSNDATATLNDTLRIAGYNGSGGGTVTVQSDSQMTARVIELGAETNTGTGTLTVKDSGSTITQTGASSLTVGHATAGTAALNVQSGASYTTGTGTTAINATGTINNSANFFLNGAMNINGKFEQTGTSALLYGPSSTATVNSGGQLNLRGGNTNLSNITLNSGSSMIVGATGVGSYVYTNTLNLQGGSITGAGPAPSIFTNVIQNLNNLTFGGNLRIGVTTAGASTPTPISLTTTKTLTTTGELVVGFDKPVNITVGGTGAALTGGFTTILGFVAGSGGSSVTVNSGGLFEANGTLQIGGNIFFGDGGASTVTINGATGQTNLDVSAPAVIFNGSALHIQNGGAIMSDVDIRSGAQLNKTGGTLTAGPVTNAGTFNSAGTSTVASITGTGTTNVTGSTPTSSLGIKQGTLSISNGATAQVTVNGTSAALSKVSTLNVNATGTLDLNDNDLVVVAGAGTYSAVNAKLGQGYNFGDWAGTGIRSASAGTAGNTGLGIVTGQQFLDNDTLGAGTFSGHTVAANDLLVKYTYQGDNNIDGAVDDADLFIFLPAYTGSQTGGWIDGDYTYDGFVDDADLFLFLPNYTGGASGLNAALASMGLEPTPAILAAESSGLIGSALVPEPATLSLLALGAGSLLRRRRR